MQKTSKCAWLTTMAVVLAIGLMALAPVRRAYAAATYPDVTVKTVGRQAYTAVKFVKKHGGYKGVIVGTKYVKQQNGLYKKVVGKFQPFKAVTKSEFVRVLSNLYGDRNVVVTVADMRTANGAATEKWARTKLVATAKKLGYPITWKGANRKLTRISAANYLYVFATYNSAFMPN